MIEAIAAKLIHARTNIDNALNASDQLGDGVKHRYAPKSPEPEHYRRFPSMKPWVGRRRYKYGAHKELLIIGESHYFQNLSTIHNDAARWYTETIEAQLTEDEQNGICPEKLIGTYFKATPNHPPFSIYKNVAIEVNDLGPRHANYVEAMEDLAFYNYFQRPAKRGGSLDETGLDCRKAREVPLNWILSELEPEIIIFSSALAGKYGPTEVRHLARLAGCSIPSIGVTPHAGSAHWNMRAEACGGRTGRELFAKSSLTSAIGSKAGSPNTLLVPWALPVLSLPNARQKPASQYHVSCIRIGRVARSAPSHHRSHFLCDGESSPHQGSSGR